MILRYISVSVLERVACITCHTNIPSQHDYGRRWSRISTSSVAEMYSAPSTPMNDKEERKCMIYDS